MEGRIDLKDFWSLSKKCLVLAISAGIAAGITLTITGYYITRVMPLPTGKYPPGTKIVIGLILAIMALYPALKAAEWIQKFCREVKPYIHK